MHPKIEKALTAAKSVNALIFERSEIQTQRSRAIHKLPELKSERVNLAETLIPRAENMKEVFDDTGPYSREGWHDLDGTPEKDIKAAGLENLKRRLQHVEKAIVEQQQIIQQADADIVRINADIEKARQQSGEVVRIQQRDITKNARAIEAAQSEVDRLADLIEQQHAFQIDPAPLTELRRERMNLLADSAEGKADPERLARVSADIATLEDQSDRAHRIRQDTIEALQPRLEQAQQVLAQAQDEHQHLIANRYRTLMQQEQDRYNTAARELMDAYQRYDALNDLLRELPDYKQAGAICTLPELDGIDGGESPAVYDAEYREGLKAEHRLALFEPVSHSEAA